MSYFNLFNNFNSCCLHNFCASFARASFYNFNLAFLNASFFNLGNLLFNQPFNQPFSYGNNFGNPWFFNQTPNVHAWPQSALKFNTNLDIWSQGGLNYNYNNNYDYFKFSDTVSFNQSIKTETDKIDYNDLSSANLKKIKKECYSPKTGFSLESAKIDKLYKAMGLDKKGLNKKVFKRAIEGYNNLTDKGNGYLGIFDTTQGSDKKRYYMLDLNNLKLIGQTEIKEGSGNMADITTANKSGSHATLSGFEKVGSSYKSQKSWEKGILLHGLEEGINDTARERGCVAHYTTGNSTLGCKGITPVIENGKINKEKSFEKLDKFFPEGAIIFTYPKDDDYWEMSELYA